MSDSLREKNMNALKEKTFNVKFDLKDTDFEEIETIGSGAYGVVCSAFNKVTKEKVAIKKITNIFQLQEIAKRTYREIKILRHFKHDNIISIQEIIAHGIESGKDPQDVYIVLDLMESDLHRIIHSTQPLTEEHTRYFLYQLLRGLKYIHSANVIHRDLKPSNLLVKENCDLKIGDFGMARGLSSNPDPQEQVMTKYVATRWYRAPEVMLLPSSYTVAIDMWSVGCIFAEMMGRRQIFQGRTPVEQLNLIIGIVGTPSTNFLSKVHSPVTHNYIKGLEVKEAESFEKLYPRAAPSALDLLRRTLTMDPEHRISVHEALSHPFLYKYHDEGDEPICIPTFNFDFENEVMDSARLRKEITSEVISARRKPFGKTPMLFNFKPVPKSELEKSRTGSQRHAGNKVNSSENLHKKHETKTKVLDDTKKDVNLMGNFFSQDGINFQTVEQKLPEKLNMASVNDTAKVDVDMTSAKNETKGLLVSTGEKATADVEMLSAKNTPGVASKDETAKKDEPLDTKALIKAALLNSKRRQKVDGQNEPARSVTAIQRQREREERRRKKKERGAYARRKKENNKGSSDKSSNDSQVTLTDEDKSLLERWRTMQVTTTSQQSQQTPSVPTQTQSNLIQATNIPTATSQDQPINTFSLTQPSTTVTNFSLPLTTFTPVPADPLIGLTNTGNFPSTSIEQPSNKDQTLGEFLGMTSFATLPTTTSLAPILLTTQVPEASGLNIPNILTESVPADDNSNQLLLPTSSTVFGVDMTDKNTDKNPDLETTDSLSVLSRQLMKSHVEDLTLMHTPKGTGGGYGVGLEFSLEDALGQGPNVGGLSRIGQDSAPLSASLISDWLDVAGNLDNNDLEALQRELELNSPVINQLVDFNSLPDP